MELDVKCIHAFQFQVGPYRCETDQLENSFYIFQYSKLLNSKHPHGSALFTSLPTETSFPHQKLVDLVRSEVRDLQNPVTDMGDISFIRGDPWAVENYKPD